MKRSYLLYLFWIFVSSSGCEKGTITNSDCADGGTFVKKVNNVTGRVLYDSTETKFMIVVPNSFDSHDVGFVCSLDTAVQKLGLTVTFSGRYYNYYKPLSRFAGDKFYSLSVDSISR